MCGITLGLVRSVSVGPVESMICVHCNWEHGGLVSDFHVRNGEDGIWLLAELKGRWLPWLPSDLGLVSRRSMCASHELKVGHA